jgi:hypothetical protein
MGILIFSVTRKHGRARLYSRALILYVPLQQQAVEHMTRTREQIREERRQLRDTYGNLFDSVAALLFRHDPIGINFDDNSDE